MKKKLYSCIIAMLAATPAFSAPHEDSLVARVKNLVQSEQYITSSRVLDSLLKTPSAKTLLKSSEFLKLGIQSYKATYDYKKVVELGEKILKVAPSEKEYYLEQMAFASREIAEFKDAHGYYDKLIKLNPGETRYYLQKGETFLQDNDGFFAHYFLKKTPNADTAPYAFYLFAWSLYQLKDTAQPSKYIRQYYDVLAETGKPESTDFEVHLNFAKMYLAARDTLSADKHLDKSLALLAEEQPQMNSLPEAAKSTAGYKRRQNAIAELMRLSGKKTR